MTSPPVTTTPGTSVKDAARLLRDARVAAVPVLEADGSLVGMVSELDLLRGTVVPDPVAHLLPVPTSPEPVPRTVGEVMTREVAVVAPHSDLHDAASLMRTSGVRSLPVLEHGRVVGVVSRADLLRVLAREDDEVAADVRARVAQEGGALPAVEVRVVDGVATLSSAPADELAAARVVAARVPGVVRVDVDPAPGQV
jgi:CBS domain-containing protein